VEGQHVGLEFKPLYQKKKKKELNCISHVLNICGRSNVPRLLNSGLKTGSFCFILVGSHLPYVRSTTILRPPCWEGAQVSHVKREKPQRELTCQTCERSLLGPSSPAQLPGECRLLSDRVNAMGALDHPEIPCPHFLPTESWEMILVLSHYVWSGLLGNNRSSQHPHILYTCVYSYIHTHKRVYVKQDTPAHTCAGPPL
jgi:hypothetical protein